MLLQESVKSHLGFFFFFPLICQEPFGLSVGCNPEGNYGVFVLSRLSHSPRASLILLIWLQSRASNRYFCQYIFISYASRWPVNSTLLLTAVILSVWAASRTRVKMNTVSSHAPCMKECICSLFWPHQQSVRTQKHTRKYDTKVLFFFCILHFALWWGAGRSSKEDAR